MLKTYRLHKKLTQEELAKIVGIDVRSIQRYENGEGKPTINILKRLIKALNIKDKDILNYIKK